MSLAVFEQGVSGGYGFAVKGITDPADLRGKKITTPFVSTAYYSLLARLKHWGIPASEVNLLNLRRQEIAAAWETRLYRCA
ncbi:ABC transporter substrate-binding protein [Pseudogemmobacter sonorensis]|uniref:ABC transporter substrate-binding protein n=1 Tax=Pseudogemmobacter sonorensis TaxID=2989681 RepID=UPI0036BCB106